MKIIKKINIKKIRRYEKAYHDNLYNTKKLWEKWSWLANPIDSVIDALDYLSKKNISVLDIWCGVWRHAIPIAKAIQNKRGRVVWIDILDSAKIKFNENQKRNLIPKQSLLFKKTDIEDYIIQKESFDYIFAVSCLEHVSNVDNLDKVLKKITNWTKKWWINYIIISVDNTLFDPTHNTYLQPMVEINLKLNEAKKLLNKYYWKRKKIEFSTKLRESKQNHIKEFLIQKWNSIRLMYQKK